MNDQDKDLDCNNVVDEETKNCKYSDIKTQQNNEIINNPAPTPQKEEIDNESLDDNKKGDKIALISLILFFIPSLFVNTAATKYVFLLQYIDPLVHIAGIIIMIYGRIKYPKNQLLKAVMWIMIITIIILIVIFVYLAITCNEICSSIPD